MSNDIIRTVVFEDGFCKIGISELPGSEEITSVIAIELCGDREEKLKDERWHLLGATVTDFEKRLDGEVVTGFTICYKPTNWQRERFLEINNR